MFVLKRHRPQIANSRVRNHPGALTLNFWESRPFGASRSSHAMQCSTVSTKNPLGHSQEPDAKATALPRPCWPSSSWLWPASPWEPASGRRFNQCRPAWALQVWPPSLYSLFYALSAHLAWRRGWGSVRAWTSKTPTPSSQMPSDSVCGSECVCVTLGTLQEQFPLVSLVYERGETHMHVRSYVTHKNMRSSNTPLWKALAKSHEAWKNQLMKGGKVSRGLIRGGLEPCRSLSSISSLCCHGACVY